MEKFWIVQVCKSGHRTANGYLSSYHPMTQTSRDQHWLTMFTCSCYVCSIHNKHNPTLYYWDNMIFGESPWHQCDKDTCYFIHTDISYLLNILVHSEHNLGVQKQIILHLTTPSRPSLLNETNYEHETSTLPLSVVPFFFSMLSDAFFISQSNKWFNSINLYF
jgi:hypothetical protein